MSSMAATNPRWVQEGPAARSRRGGVHAALAGGLEPGLGPGPRRRRRARPCPRPAPRPPPRSWLSPEILKGEKASFEADVYAFG